MKYNVHTYAKALARAIAGVKDSAAIGGNFLKLLRKNGDEAHAGKIIEEAARMARRGTGIRKITVESARKLSSNQEKEIHKFLKHDDTVEREIDPELIAGIRIIVNDELQFDGSLRGKLERIFTT